MRRVLHRTRSDNDKRKKEENGTFELCKLLESCTWTRSASEYASLAVFLFCKSLCAVCVSVRARTSENVVFPLSFSLRASLVRPPIFFSMITHFLPNTVRSFLSLRCGYSLGMRPGFVGHRGCNEQQLNILYHIHANTRGDCSAEVRAFNGTVKNALVHENKNELALLALDQLFRQ